MVYPFSIEYTNAARSSDCADCNDSGFRLPIVRIILIVPDMMVVYGYSV